MAYHRYHGLDTKIVRIFNTYGPRMRLNDGRAVPAFMSQALRNEDVTVFGDGSQTRSFTYITDLVDGIIRLMLSDVNDPVNIGNPREMTIEEIARDDHPDDRLEEPDRLQAAADRRPEESASPTSPARARCSDGSRRCRSKRGWSRRSSISGRKSRLEARRRATTRPLRRGDACDAVQGLQEGPPGAPLRGEQFPALCGNAVIAAPALTRFLHPSPLDESL